MNLPLLIDPARSVELRRRLAARLHERLATAPAQALISITIDLGAGSDDWLDADFGSAHTFWWARPESDEWRLALGQALIVASAGPNRFPALQAAFAGIAANWQNDDADGCGLRPAAHLGFAFDEEAQDDLPNARLIVPTILLVSRRGRLAATFSCVARAGEAALDDWLATLRLRTPRRPACATAATAGTQPLAAPLAAPLADRAFVARVRAALAEIAAGRLQKVVVSRRVRVAATRPIALAPLLAALAARHPACTLYAVGRPGFAFVGATPERLVALKDGVAHADALAGTAWTPADSSASPASLALDGDKNSREQGLVVDAVRTALSPLCTALEQAAMPEVLRLRDLQHLRTTFSGRVRERVGLFELIAALHPTPAVGGTPAPAARAWLRSHRERRDAWYTGGIGWIDASGDGEIVVALRCARIDGRIADCYAGAGIVAGSDPEQEFAETEIKLAAAIDALCHAASVDENDALRTGTQ